MPSNISCKPPAPAADLVALAALLGAIAAVAPELKVGHLALLVAVLAGQVEVAWPPVDVG